jgi:hypothetical protein
VLHNFIRRGAATSHFSDAAREDHRQAVTMASDPDGAREPYG